MKTMSYRGMLGAILDEWNALEILFWCERGKGKREKRKKKNLGESLKRGEPRLMTRKEMESQLFIILAGARSVFIGWWLL